MGQQKGILFPRVHGCAALPEGRPLAVSLHSAFLPFEITSFAGLPFDIGAPQDAGDSPSSQTLEHTSLAFV